MTGRHRLTEHDLVTQATTGDRDAFGALLRGYGDPPTYPGRPAFRPRPPALGTFEAEVETRNLGAHGLDRPVVASGLNVVHAG